MRDALIVFFAAAGLALFVIGDVLWLVQRGRGRPIDLRLTGAPIAAGVTFFGLAIVLRLT